MTRAMRNVRVFGLGPLSLALLTLTLFLVSAPLASAGGVGKAKGKDKRKGPPAPSTPADAAPEEGDATSTPGTTQADRWDDLSDWGNAGNFSREQFLRWGYLTELNPTSLPLVTGDLGFSIRPEGLGFDEAHKIVRGGRVVVAILDGGFNLDHPFVAGNVLPGYDAVDRDGDVNDRGNGLDDDADGVVDEGLGHGTFVAGMVLLAAPDATILALRVRDDEGKGSDTTFDDVGGQANVPGFEVRVGRREGWPEVSEAGAAADVDASLAEVGDSIGADA